MKILSSLFGCIFVAYILFGTYLFFFQESYIFFPEDYDYPSPSGLSMESVEFQTSDGINLHGWLLETGSEKTVLFFHGNAGSVSSRRSQMEMFDALNLNALIFDYRGYGLSEGTIKKEADLYTDAKAAFDFLNKEREVPLEKMILWGRSLGGAVAIDTAQDKDAYATIVESTFTTMNAMAQKSYPFFPTDLVLRYHFDSEQKIQNITSPFLVIHSSEDDLIPFSHGQVLFEKANEPKQFLEIQGDHDNGFIESKDLYLTKIKAFLEDL